MKWDPSGGGLEPSTATGTATATATATGTTAATAAKTGGLPPGLSPHRPQDLIHAVAALTAVSIFSTAACSSPTPTATPPAQPAAKPASPLVPPPDASKLAAPPPSQPAAPASATPQPESVALGAPGERAKRGSHNYDQAALKGDVESMPGWADFDRQYNPAVIGDKAGKK